jgi:DNA-binding transcriptional LysR family regulator
MQLSQIQYFLESARRLNFTRAAAVCGVSQPALSRGIKALEHELGGALLYRSPTVAVTELGRRVLPFMQQMFDAAQLARLQAASLRHGTVTPVAIGFDVSVSPAMLSDTLGNMQRLFNGLALRLETADASSLRRRLIEGELDLLVRGHHEHDEPGPLRRIRLAQEDCVLVHPPGHPFAGNSPLPAHKLLTAADRIRFCDTAEHILRDLGTLVPERHQASSVEHLVQLVDARMGWGLLPAGHPMASGRPTRMLCDPPLRRVVELVYVAGRPHTKGVSTLLRLARMHEARVA